MQAIYCHVCQTMIPMACCYTGRLNCPRPIACPWQVPDWQWALAFISMGPRLHFQFPCRPVAATGWVDEPE
jgi:hypothetical protein